MFRNRQRPETNAALERRVRELLSPLAGAEPANSAARSALSQALHRAPSPGAHRLHAWQRAAVGLAGVFVPLFAIGSVAGLGGPAAVTTRLDAVAGVFKSNNPAGAGGGGQVVALLEEEPTAQDEVSAAISGADMCAEATEHAREVLEALLAGETLGDSGAAGVAAALAAIEECGAGAGSDGAAMCLEATATAREVLQALLDTEELPEAGRTGIEKAIAAIDACGPGDDEDDIGDEAGVAAEEDGDTAAAETAGGPGTGHEKCYPATEHAREVLQSLLDREGRPEGSMKGIERALEAIENCGTGNGGDAETGDDGTTGTTAGEPEPAATGSESAATTSHGKPDAAAKPGAAAKPETSGQAAGNGSGKPDITGKPDDTGKPEAAGGPGVNVSGEPRDAGKPEHPGGSANSGNGGPPDHAGGPPAGDGAHGPGEGSANGGNPQNGNRGGPANRPGRP